jgi:hypothetical protein
LVTVGRASASSSEAKAGASKSRSNAPSAWSAASIENVLDRRRAARLEATDRRDADARAGGELLLPQLAEQPQRARTLAQRAQRLGEGL